MQTKLRPIFGERFEILDYSDASFIEFEHHNNKAVFAFRKIVYPGSIKFGSLSVKKRFNEIESILQPILHDFGIRIGFWNSTIFKDLKYESEELNLEDNLSIERELKDIREKFIHEENDFLNKFKSIEDVYHASEEMEIQDMVKFISQPLPFRRILLKFLNKDENFVEFSEHYIESARQKALNKPVQFKNYDKAAKHLFDVLRSMEKV